MEIVLNRLWAIADKKSQYIHIDMEAPIPSRALGLTSCVSLETVLQTNLPGICVIQGPYMCFFT